MKVLITSLAIAGTLALSPSAAGAGDRTCAAAQTVSEKIVCANAQLNQLDQRLSRFYGWLLISLGDRERLLLHDEQRLFLAFRDACGGDQACLRASYLTRIEDLAGRLRQVAIGPGLS